MTRLTYSIHASETIIADADSKRRVILHAGLMHQGRTKIEYFAPREKVFTESFETRRQALDAGILFIDDKSGAS